MSHELIKRRRLQLIVHSAIYYHFNSNIVSDNKYDGWTHELVALHKQYPDYSDRYDEYFDNWNGETGYHFPKDDHILSIADGLLRTHDRKLNQQELAGIKPEPKKEPKQMKPTAPVLDEFFDF